MSGLLEGLLSPRTIRITSYLLPNSHFPLSQSDLLAIPSTLTPCRHRSRCADLSLRPQEYPHRDLCFVSDNSRSAWQPCGVEGEEYLSRYPVFFNQRLYTLDDSSLRKKNYAPALRPIRSAVLHCVCELIENAAMSGSRISFPRYVGEGRDGGVVGNGASTLASPPSQPSPVAGGRSRSVITKISRVNYAAPH